MNKIAKEKIHIQDIKDDDLGELIKQLTKRQKNPEFMNFLKEAPMDERANLEVLLEKINQRNGTLKRINVEGVEESIGFELFHNFNEERRKMEISSRIDPMFWGKGICTHTKEQAIKGILESEDVDSIVSRHSVRNRGTFETNRKAGFKLVDFVPDQTRLSNLQKRTDDFKRMADEESLDMSVEELIHPSVDTKTKERIQEALEKHIKNIKEVCCVQ